MSRMFYVYELRDQNGVVFYVGKGSGARIHSHEIKARKGCMSHRSCKIRKIWADGGFIDKVKVWRGFSESEAFTEEKRLIAFYGRDNLTNKTDGGDGPSNPSPDVREKMASARRGKKASLETKLKLSLSHIGLTQSEETKAKISAKQRTIKKPWAVAGASERLKKCGGFKGRKWSDEHRKRFNEARKGHSVSQETRDKISKSKKGTIPWNKKTNQKSAVIN